MKDQKKKLCALLLAFCFLLSACRVSVRLEPSETTENPAQTVQEEENQPTQDHNFGSKEEAEEVITIDTVPPFEDEAYIAINNNEPEFSDADMTTEAFERYSELDELGRCGVAYANVCLDTMPTEERGSISHVKPSGWHSTTYDCVDGRYLYNRCHLIGYQLTAENANAKNLITGTRYLNIDGMLLFENMVADYVKETENHVLYRVTPVFEDENLVATGVQMEGKSVEDDGEGISFNVFCYNSQPGVTIDYATGDSCLAEAADEAAGESYVLNTKLKKFHTPSCSSAASMKADNREDYTGSREELIQQGYTACKNCKP